MRELLAALADAILALQRTHPILIAIDGRSAAGKSTFAAALAARLVASGRQVLRVALDDFHPPGHSARSRERRYTPETLYEEGYDYRAFATMVLEPLKPGGDRRVRLGLFDSARGRPIEDRTAVAEEDGLVVVDGAFLLRPEFIGVWNVAVWLDISIETMLERAVRRDIAWVGDADRVRENYRRGWIPTHLLYEATGAREAADVVIGNEDWERPRLIRSRLELGGTLTTP